MTKRVDYDQIAPSYNHRYHANRLERIEHELLTCAENKRDGRVLEVGCGTGHWLDLIASVANSVYGLDLSSGMLAQAHQQNPSLHLIQGRAGILPFASQSFDLVFCVNALHHFDDPHSFITGTWSLLKSGGVLVIIGQVPHDHRNQWYVYDFFEGTYESDLRRFPAWDTVTGWMEQTGYKEIKRNPVETIIDHKYGRGVLKDPFLEKNAVSQLALLSDQAYRRGLERIRQAIEAAEAHGENLTFQTELRLEMLTGTKN